MPIVLGVDLGTTSITSLAMDTTGGDILARATTANQAAITTPADRARGFSEWDAAKIVAAACACLRATAARLPAGAVIAGIGLTGQQHGVVVLDGDRKPLTPLINWQDRRLEETFRSSRTFLQEAAGRLGPEAPQRTGCKIASGFMAGTLFWLNEKHLLPSPGSACFLIDYFGALLTGSPPVTDATNAAGSGVFDIMSSDWAVDLIGRLGLPPAIFPPVRRAGDLFGALQPGLTEATGLPSGLPVFVGIGDHQASFLGSVAGRRNSVLINVGTGAQVAAFTDHFLFDPALETRPFPRGGYLLVCPGLSGGRSYALMEGFFRQVGQDLLGVNAPISAYARMNDLACAVKPGADGLRCEPYFAGTRADPLLRASWTGMSAENFTPGHMVRALLEGMARVFRSSYAQIRAHLAHAPANLVGAGNGMRENPLLVEIVAEEFSMRVRLSTHPEEAAYGAALLAAVGAGVFSDLDTAASLLRYAD